MVLGIEIEEMITLILEVVMEAEVEEGEVEEDGIVLGIGEVEEGEEDEEVEDRLEADGDILGTIQSFKRKKTMRDGVHQNLMIFGHRQKKSELIECVCSPL